MRKIAQKIRCSSATSSLATPVDMMQVQVGKQSDIPDVMPDGGDRAFILDGDWIVVGTSSERINLAAFRWRRFILRRMLQHQWSGLGNVLKAAKQACARDGV